MCSAQATWRTVSEINSPLCSTLGFRTKPRANPSESRQRAPCSSAALSRHPGACEVGPGPAGLEGPTLRRRRGLELLVSESVGCPKRRELAEVAGRHCHAASSTFGGSSATTLSTITSGVVTGRSAWTVRSLDLCKGPSSGKWRRSPKLAASTGTTSGQVQFSTTDGAVTVDVEAVDVNGSRGRARRDAAAPRARPARDLSATSRTPWISASRATIHSGSGVRSGSPPGSRAEARQRELLRDCEHHRLEGERHLFPEHLHRRPARDRYRGLPHVLDFHGTEGCEPWNSQRSRNDTSGNT
jgi:hypothetical protein